jgi:hypothetical protein
MQTTTADDLDLTSRDDHGLGAAILHATAPLARYVLDGGLGTEAAWSAALDRLHASRRIIERTRRVEATYGDALQQALVFLDDHARAAAIVLGRDALAAAETEGSPGPLGDAALRARRLSQLAGDLARALDGLKAA